MNASIRMHSERVVAASAHILRPSRSLIMLVKRATSSCGRHTLCSQSSIPGTRISNRIYRGSVEGQTSKLSGEKGKEANLASEHRTTLIRLSVTCTSCNHLGPYLLYFYLLVTPASQMLVTVAAATHGSHCRASRN